MCPSFTIKIFNHWLVDAEVPVSFAELIIWSTLRLPLLLLTYVPTDGYFIPANAMPII